MGPVEIIIGGNFSAEPPKALEKADYKWVEESLALLSKIVVS